MDGKQLFRIACEAEGIDCGAYFKLGCQNNRQNNGYVYRCPAVNRKPSQLYAVNYISSRGLFAAWSLRDGKKKTYNYFRIPEWLLQEYQAGMLGSVSKPLEYSGWDEETVTVFDTNAVRQFIAHVIERYDLKKGGKQ